MDEVGISIAAKLAEYLVDPILCQLQYLFCVGKITISVETTKEELILKQRRVQERVEEAINRTERIDAEVNKWKDEVVSLIAEVENLVQEQRANNGCFQRCCPTWRRYRLCKVLAKTTQRMRDLNTKSDQFEPFSHHVIVPDVEYHSSKDFMFFKSTEMAYEELWEALQGDDSSIIGLWGMGGSGKTTLVKEVGKKAKESKLFNRVIIATVSQIPDIRKIQGEIADLLGLRLEEETEVGRARRIAMKLQSSEEQILIIFDDVWSVLNLEDIGNPFRDEGSRNCKILLTTRRQEVCTLMDCQKTIPLGLLTEGEAWDLFQTHAKIDDGAKKVAQEVAVECKGLPIAIVAMGKCLKGKGLDEVNVVLHKLRHSKPVDENKAFTCLKLSYDYLITGEAKLLFLMCAMFPEDHEIVIEDLFRYGVGLGICEDADSFEIARSQVIAAINVLIDSSLLKYHVNFKNEKCIKMHDMVRDAALWIAAKEHGTIMVNCAKELHELLKDEAVKDCYAVSSWKKKNISWNKRNELLQFPSQLDAPKLELLLLNSSESLDLSRASFEGVKELKVVALIDNRFSYLTALLSQSIQLLSNIRTLRLQGLDLGDISFVVGLKKLEVLDLKGSKLKKVPNGIEKLNCLKLLDLSMCRTEECSCQIIGRCWQLEELYASGNLWPLGYTICYECFVGVCALPKLRRYTLEMGQHDRPMFWKEGLRELFFGEFNISISSAMIKDLAQRAIAVEFYKLQGGCKRFNPDVVQAIGGMNELTKLSLRCCSEIECFADQTSPHEDIVVLRLVELVLEYMYNLKQLSCGPSNCSLFLNLESLNVESCPQLVNMFPANCNLRNLKFLNIVDCPMLTYIFPFSVAWTLLSLEQLTIERCDKLKHVIESIVLFDCGVVSTFIPQVPVFQHLKQLSVGGCAKLKFVCLASICQSLPELTSITICCCEEMEEVFLGDEETQKNLSISQFCLPNLQSLEIKGCNKLKRIFSFMISDAILMLPKLRTLRISNASQLEEIFRCLNIEDNDIVSEKEIMFPNLRSIALERLPRLVDFCRGFKFQISMYYIGLVYDCPRLVPNVGASAKLMGEILVRKHVLECSQSENIEGLSSPLLNLNAEELDNLRFRVQDSCRVIGYKGSAMSNLHQILEGLTPTQGMSFIFLHCLDVVRCTKLKFLFSASTIIHNSLPKLKFLTLSDCEELEEIIVADEEPENISNALVCFPELIELEIQRCNKLKRLFSTTINTILPQLSSLRITEASQLEVIFGHKMENDVNNGEKILLPELRNIKLRNLPNFVDVCQGLQFEAVQLSGIIICKCPKFLNPILGSTQMVSLQQWESMDSRGVEDFQSEASVEKQFHCNEEKGSIMIPNVHSLALRHSANLMTIIWDGPTLISFQNLLELNVFRCRKLKSIFPCTVVKSLPRLMYLSIKECEELEEIVSKNDHFQDPSSNLSLCFPKLYKLKVYRCNKLKCLLSLPYNGDLAKLEHLEIKGCSQLEQVFSCEREIHEQESYNNLLPNLKYLELKDLPKITHICASVPFLLKLLSVRVFEVKHCPMFQNRDNVEESEDYDSDDFDFDNEDFIEFEHTRQFLDMRFPGCTLPGGEVEPSQSRRYHRWFRRML